MSKTIKSGRWNKPRARPPSKTHLTSSNKHGSANAGTRLATINLSRKARAGSKLAKLIALLNSVKGATILELSKATGWQTHSVRGAMSGTLKKKLGLNIMSVKADGVRTYRIAS